MLHGCLLAGCGLQLGVRHTASAAPLNHPCLDFYCPRLPAVCTGSVAGVKASHAGLTHGLRLSLFGSAPTQFAFWQIAVGARTAGSLAQARRSNS